MATTLAGQCYQRVPCPTNLWGRDRRLLEQRGIIVSNSCEEGRETKDIPICNSQECIVVEYTEASGLGNNLMVLSKRAMFHSRQLARKVPATMLSRSNKTATSEVLTEGSLPGLDPRPGDWVQVRPEDEIRATLDERGRHKGLYFMPEMRKYCGQTLKVRKRVENIMLESNREMRRMRTPTVILEDSVCDGESSGGCDRSCYLLWRVIWLTKAPPHPP